MSGQVRKKRLYLRMGLICRKLAELDNLDRDAGLSLGEFMYRERLLLKYYNVQVEIEKLERKKALTNCGILEELLQTA